MAINFPNSKTVRLYNVQDSTTLLHPETQLQAVVKSVGGVLNTSGNSMWVSGSDIHDAGFPYNTEIGTLAYNSLCVESATGGTVTIGGQQLGSGGLITSYTVGQTIPPYSSSHDYIVPSEKAVAAALLGKQNTLISGQAISMTDIGNGMTQIGVDLVQEVRDIVSARTSTVPSESAVRTAIDLSAAGVSAAIVASGYATSAWCLNTFWQKGETPSSGGGGGDVPYATTDVAGKVQPILNGGLTVGGAGSLTLTPASTYANYSAASSGYLGGVKVVSTIASANATQMQAPYVPHAGAVYNYIGNVLTGYVKKTDYATASGAGIVMPGTGLYMSGTSMLVLSAATDSVLGGVMVQASNGLKVTNGSLTMSSATSNALGVIQVGSSGGISVSNGIISAKLADIVSSYAEYGVTKGGRVVLTRAIDSAANATQSSLPVAPTTDAVYQAVKVVTPPFLIKSTAFAANNKLYYHSIEGDILDSDYSFLCHVNNYYSYVDANTVTTLCAKASKGVGGTWTGSIVNTSGTDTDSVKYIPIAVISAGASTAVVRQLRTGNIILGGSGSIYAGYDGPFAASGTSAASYAVSSVTVSGGLVKWLDGYLEVGSSNLTAATTVASGGYVYLVGSSGYEETAVAPITGATYNMYGTRNGSANYVWSRFPEADQAGYYAWKGAESQPTYTTEEYPTSGASGYYSPGYYDSTVIINSSYTGITVGGTNYVRKGAATAETSSTGGYEYKLYGIYGYEWANGNTSVTTLVQYPQPEHVYSSGISSMTVPADSTYSIGNYARFAYATSAPAGTPPAGTFYTQLAKNTGGKLFQEQYGAVWHEHWGNDYKGPFAITRMPIIGSRSADYVPEVGSCAAYRFAITTDGAVYGGLTFTGSLPDWMRRTSDGVIVDPANIEYPVSTVKYKDSYDNEQSMTTSDGLYPPYGTPMQVWLNIWKGAWTNHGAPNTVHNQETDRWHFVVAPSSFEGASDLPKNTYATFLGWVTGNGAPQQAQTGPIAIRGRWV